jgi:Immune inhibitor A peptidase M6./Fibronectin type III domain.
MNALLLITVFRMVVIPVEFEDRGFAAGREGQAQLVREAEAYFNRQFGEQAFEFVLGPQVKLEHAAAWYGADYPDRRDVRLAEAVKEACTAVQGELDWSRFDGDGDGFVDNVMLLYAGPGQQESEVANDLCPQQGRLSDGGGSALNIKNLKIDSFAVAPEGRLGIFCHEFGHVLGLPDLYDTDGGESGGTDRGLWGTSLMDEGCRRETPPDFGAVEFELLGLGRCDTLATGGCTLAPLLRERRYLKALTGVEGEFFLFEARTDGLHVFHVDRSENAAGRSPGHERELTARDRWDYGLVNNNPAHPCARPVPADPDATDVLGLPFPGPGGFDSFGSDTPAAFRAWSGTAPGLALTDIRPDGEGGVSFEVLEPITLLDLSVYQDAAVLRWKTDPALHGISGYLVRWSDGGQEWLRELPSGTTSCTLEGLSPGTEYRFSVQVRAGTRVRYSMDGSFTTKMQRGGMYPYIYLSGATRNVDGSFPSGSKLPLRVFNAAEVQEVQWSLDGVPIEPEADGRYTLRRSGVLRARILHTDGTAETLMKEIIVQ